MPMPETPIREWGRRSDKTGDRSQESEIRIHHDVCCTIHDTCSKTIIHRKDAKVAKKKYMKLKLKAEKIKGNAMWDEKVFV